MANEWNVEIKDTVAEAKTYMETLDSTVLTIAFAFKQGAKTKFFIANAT